MNLIYKCSFCERSFDAKCACSYHQNRCINNPNSEKYKTFNKKRKCKNCGKFYTFNDFVSENFCSRSCANTRHHSNETKQKISKSVNSFNSLHHRAKKAKKTTNCLYCGKTISISYKYKACKDCFYKHMPSGFREKLSAAGRKSAANSKNIRRSKNEILFSEFIKEKFQDILCNVNMFNGWDADVIIPQLKIAILWNGSWHYKDIFGQLKQIQNRDKIKYKEIVKTGYMPYIIVDLGRYSENKCKFEFERFCKFLDIINTLKLCSAKD